MEQALQNYERATQEAITNFRAAWEVERETLARERRGLKKHRARLDLEAAEGRRALEEDRASFAAEITGVEGMVVQPADRVLLNVGGKHFETTRRTLTAALTVAPGSLLGAMFSTRGGCSQTGREGSASNAAGQCSNIFWIFFGLPAKGMNMQLSRSTL